MAKFSTLKIEAHYDIIDGETGNALTQGIQGGAAMAADWPKGAEAWPAGETEFNGEAVEVAE